MVLFRPLKTQAWAMLINSTLIQRLCHDRWRCVVSSPGDFNTVPERHLAGASIPRLCPDLLITESTYATSIRQDRRTRETYLLNLVRPH
jgi:Cft2 family RNA processing exonuclease